jgi:hydrogenase 3 maturation protease
MSKPSWKTKLNQKTASLRQSDSLFRVAVIGIGQELNGDDAAGIMVVRGLTPLLANVDRLCVIDAGPAPENVTGSLREFRPALVLLVDAAQMNEEPGTVRWLEWQETTGLSASTHTLPLHMLAMYLTTELSCEVAVIGIQPFNNLFDEPLSLVVRNTVNEIVSELHAALIL